MGKIASKKGIARILKQCRQPETFQQRKQGTEKLPNPCIATFERTMASKLVGRRLNDSVAMLNRYIATANRQWHPANAFP